MSTSVETAVLVPLMASVFGLTVSVPSPPQEPQELGAHVIAGGPYAVFWSVLDDCFGRGGEDAAVCLKYKALTVLDWALSNPSAVIADGVLLTTGVGQSSGPDDTLRADCDDTLRADRDDTLRADCDDLARHDLAILDAVSDPDRKHALLDDMLASRMEEFVSTRAIAANGGAGIILGNSQQTQITGNSYTYNVLYSFSIPVRGKKKSKTMKQAVMMTCVMTIAFMWPLVWSVIYLIAIEALAVSKIALTLSSYMAIEKFLSQKQKKKSRDRTSRGSLLHPNHVIQSLGYSVLGTKAINVCQP